jgi:NitT/TauT family transport system substrate-binding protein
MVRAQTGTTIRVGAPATDETTPLQYAIRGGLYAKAGLDVQFVALPAGTDATSALLGGTCDIVLASPVALIAARAKAVPVIGIGNAAVGNPRVPCALMGVAKDSTIKEAADLNGQTLGVPALDGLDALAVKDWVDQNGGDVKTLKFVEVVPEGAGDALTSHSVAAAMLHEPQLTAALAAKTVRRFAEPYGAIDPHLVRAVYVARQDWASAHATETGAFAKTTYAAAAYTNAHHADTVAMMADVTKIPPEVLAKMNRATGATAADPPALQPVIDAAAKYRVITTWFDAKDAYFKAVPVKG